ncbi:MAG: hypothetical protein CMH84_13465 [Nocardioides sp.]|jgi:hypothetical protein|nr:hypothetical protein [Nocardioides sp.]
MVRACPEADGSHLGPVVAVDKVVGRVTGSRRRLAGARLLDQRWGGSLALVCSTSGGVLAGARLLDQRWGGSLALVCSTSGGVARWRSPARPARTSTIESR